MAKKFSNDPLVNMKKNVDYFIEYVAEQMATKGVEGVLKLFDPNDPEYPKDFADKVGGLINSTLFNIPLRGRPPLVYVGPPDEKGNIKYLDPSKAQRLILENIIAGRRWMEGLALVEYNSETMPRRYKVEWTKGDVLRDIKRFAAKELSTRRGVASAIKDTKAKYAELMAEDFAKIPITVSASEYENVEDTWSKHFERWWREQTSPQNIENFRKDNNLNKYITSYGRRVGFYGDVPGSNGLKFIMWSKVRVPTSDRFQYEDLALGDDVKNNAINIVENWAELPWVIPDSVLDQLNQIVTSQIGHFVGVENQKAKAQIQNLHTLLGLIQDKIDNIDANSSNSPGGEIERTQIAAQSTLDMVTRKLAIMNTNMELGDINDELFFSLKKLYEQNSLGLDTETYLEALRELKKNNGFNIDLFIETKLKQKNPDQEVLTYNFGVMLNIGKDKLYTVESALSNQIKAIFAKYQSQISNLIVTKKHSPSTMESTIARFLSESFPSQKNKLKKYIKKSGGTRRLAHSSKRIKNKITPVKGLSTKVKSTRKSIRKYNRKRKTGTARKNSGSRTRGQGVGGLVSILNANIQAAVREQMVAPSLRYRTGRFASSVQITNIDAAKGSIMYKYLQNPYDIFSGSRGAGPWNSVPQRDPEFIIDNAIRSLGSLYAKELGSNITTMRG